MKVKGASEKIKIISPLITSKYCLKEELTLMENAIKKEIS